MPKERRGSVWRIWRETAARPTTRRTSSLTLLSPLAYRCLPPPHPQEIEEASAVDVEIAVDPAVDPVAVPARMRRRSGTSS